MLAALVVFLALSAHPDMSFDEFCAEFGKHYNAHEYLVRKEIFERNVEAVKLHNSHPGQSYQKGLNHLSDRTDAEMASLFGFSTSMHLNRRLKARNLLRPRNVTTSRLSLPDSVDWTQQNATTHVKNQGGCGSCWAFAATEAIESCGFLGTGKLFELAPQEFVDCVQNPNQCGGQGGCEGATPDLAFNYTSIYGAVEEKAYPYVGRDGKCEMKERTPVLKVGAWVDVDVNSYEGLLAAVAKQPVTIGVAANQWGLYSSGVFSFKDCDSEINHAVLLVGYGTDPEHGAYWKVQNSWGTTWGEKGFIRLARSADDASKCQVDKNPSVGYGCTGGPSEVTVCGTCGILYGATYPVNCTLA